MKPASIMSLTNEQSVALHYLQPEYARALADEAVTEGFVLMR